MHFCEQSGVGNWLNVFVHTPLAHSVLVSLTVVQSEPKPRPPLFASTAGGLLPLQATANTQATDIAIARRKALRILRSYQRSRSGSQISDESPWLSLGKDTVSPERHLDGAVESETTF